MDNVRQGDTIRSSALRELARSVAEYGLMYVRVENMQPYSVYASGVFCEFGSAEVDVNEQLRRRVHLANDIIMGKTDKKAKKKVVRNAGARASTEADLKLSVEEFLSGNFSNLPVSSKEIPLAPKKNKSNITDKTAEMGDGDMAEARMDMDKLQSKDPEFYQYLQQNDAELLNFSGEEDGGSSDRDAPEENRPRKKALASHNDEEKVVLTLKTLRLLEKAVFEDHSILGLRQLVQAFAAGCHMSDEADTVRDYRFLVKDSVVYNELMNLVLNRIYEAFNFHFNDAILKREKKNASKEKVLFSASSRWSKLKATVKSFLANYVHMLETLTDPAIREFSLDALKHFILMIPPLDSLAKKILRVLLDTWSNSQQENVRLMAFLRIRQLTQESPVSFVEQAMKGIYLSYVRNAKFLTEITKPTVDLMSRCVVELFSLDLKTAYQCAFIYIRQLAIHIRTALKDKSADSAKNVYNWQFMNCLRVWTSLLMAYPKQDELRPLVYPLVQILISSMRMCLTARYLPFRFHCVELLIGLSAATDGAMVPVVSFIMGALRDSSLHAKPKGTMKKAPRLELIVKVNPKEMDIQQYKDAVVTKALELLDAHFNLHKFSISFPEIVMSGMIGLRRFQRQARVARWRQQSKALVARLERSCIEIEKQRTGLPFAPSDVEKCNKFLAVRRAQAQQAHVNKSVDSDMVLKRKLKDVESGPVKQGGLDLKFSARKKKMKMDKKEKKEEARNTKSAPIPGATDIENIEDIVEDVVFSDEDGEN